MAKLSTVVLAALLMVVLVHTSTVYSKRVYKERSPIKKEKHGCDQDDDIIPTPTPNRRFSSSKTKRLRFNTGTKFPYGHEKPQENDRKKPQKKKSTLKPVKKPIQHRPPPIKKLLHTSKPPMKTYFDPVSARKRILVSLPFQSVGEFHRFGYNSPPKKDSDRERDRSRNEDQEGDDDEDEEAHITSSLRALEELEALVGERI